MPIWLRRYTFNTIREYYEQKNKEQETKPKSSKPKGPDINPTYSTKASTK